ncbi:restriction endonuclease subunit S [Aeromonas media]|uniref:restriction endonuclease subunit S n=1 Tax=Aeromonas media TaxID=651 RepID=UPI00370C04C1
MKTGWERKPLGSVCTLQRGLDLPTPQRVKGIFPLVSSSGVIDTHIEGPIKGPGVITGRSGSVGKVFFVNEDFWPLNTTLYVRDFHGNEPRFVFHLLNHFDLQRFAGGAGVPTLNRNDVHGEPVFVPSDVQEQQRIVAILDEAFEAIAAARANAEQNCQNARALFESYLQSVFSQHGDGWTEKPLGEMATFRNGVNFTKSSQGEQIKILGVKDFQDYYWAPLNSLDSIIPDGTLPDTDTLQQNDIVFVRSNGNPELIGRCLLIGEVQERTTFSGFTIRARRFTEEVLPQYLCHFLKSFHIRRELVDGGNGANIRSLNQGALSKLRINFPVELSEQERIVERLETMQSETQHLESLYQHKIAALDELKQSLLQQAFSGQL